MITIEKSLKWAFTILVAYLGLGVLGYWMAKPIGYIVVSVVSMLAIAVLIKRINRGLGRSEANED